MIKIATAQIDVIPGNIRENWKRIEKEIQRAREKGAHMLVLPEMCLTGYLIGDLWDQNAFLRECEAYNEKIAAASRDITILWGSCAIDWKKTNDDGRPRKYNAAFAAAGGHSSFRKRAGTLLSLKPFFPITAASMTAATLPPFARRPWKKAFP